MCGAKSFSSLHFVSFLFLIQFNAGSNEATRRRQMSSFSFENFTRWMVNWPIKLFWRKGEKWRTETSNEKYFTRTTIRNKNGSIISFWTKQKSYIVFAKHFTRLCRWFVHLNGRSHLMGPVNSCRHSQKTILPFHVLFYWRLVFSSTFNSCVDSNKCLIISIDTLDSLDIWYQGKMVRTFVWNSFLQLQLHLFSVQIHIFQNKMPTFKSIFD